MRKKLMIIGASGHSKVLLDIVNLLDDFDEIAFLDDDVSKRSHCGFKVLGTSKDIAKFVSDYVFHVGIGNNAVRKKLSEIIRENNGELISLIHPSAVISPSVNIEEGSAILAGVVINADARIGKGCIINTASVIEHDNLIGDYVHVSPNATLSGTVEVGNESWIGAGATVINNITIGSNVIVGAGSVVIRNIDDNLKVVGNPTRVLT